MFYGSALILVTSCCYFLCNSKAVNITPKDVPCWPDDHLVVAESTRRRLLSLGNTSAKDASQPQQQHLGFLEPQSSSRRFSCPSRSVDRSPTDDDERPAEAKQTATSDGRHQAVELQEMSTLFTVVEKLISDALVRPAFINLSKSEYCMDTPQES